jgi:hypothetical protein
MYCLFDDEMKCRNCYVNDSLDCDRLKCSYLEKMNKFETNLENKKEKPDVSQPYQII